MKKVDLFVPGRVCLFGEHSDWAGGHRRTNADIEKGYAIVTGTNQGIYAEVSAHLDSLVLTSTTSSGTKTNTIPFSEKNLLQEAQQGKFWSYVAGVAYQIQKKYPVKGLVLNNTKTDLPVRKGLSSSAAISVLTARAFNQVYKLGLTIQEEMEFAYLGEITTPSRCGRMDQACAYGNQPVLMSFDADKLAVQPLSVGKPIHLVIVDLHGKKDTKKILTDLNKAYPFAQTADERNIHTLLGSLNQKITQEAVKILKLGDAKRLGRLMTKAQKLFDKYAQPLCPDELTSPILHRLLENKILQPYIWGGKGIGSQGDGSAQLVAKDKILQQKLMQMISNDLHMTAIELTICSN